MAEKDITTTVLYRKTLGCLYGGLIGDAMGTPSEGMDYPRIEKELGWISDFQSDGTDDTVLRDILAATLIRTDGQGTLDDWAQDWLSNFDAIFGAKSNKFFLSVLHTARKLKIQGVPRMAALGSVPCSSSAMCMAPVGIVNACNPRLAALQAYNLASLMNVHDAGVSQDGAAAIAAAVAEACKPQATVQSILAAAADYLEQISGAAVVRCIRQALDVAETTGSFRAFREYVYGQPERFFQLAKNNAQETVPMTLALFWLAKGEVETTITYAANFGRDTDTMAAMGGAIAGALHGVDGIKPEWLARARQYASVNQEEMALRLTQATLRKLAHQRSCVSMLDSVAA